MKIINLRLYYPHYEQDKLVEVSEEVFDALCQSVREMRNYERRKQYHRAYYSLDAYDWTENYALEHSPSPEQLVMLAEEQAERDRLAAAFREALTYATPIQARRVCAYCQRRDGFVVFRRTENVEKWRVKVYSLCIIILAVFARQA